MVGTCVNRWHPAFCLKKMKKGVDSFKIGCYSDKAVARNCALKKGCRGVKKLLKKEKDS